jgi:transmembrane sensor
MKLAKERREEAAAWFAAQRRAAMSLEERAKFDAWRADPQNLAALNAMHELWGEMAAIKGVRPALHLPSHRGRRVAAALAACVVLALGSVVAVSLVPFGAAQTAETAIGEQRAAILPDGSTVEMNVATRIDYRMEPDRREVRLREGQALFVVKPDKARPFLVRAGDYEVRAVGTAFDVRQRDGTTQISVQEGSVAVKALRGDRAGQVVAQMTPGQTLRLPTVLRETAVQPRPQTIAVQTVAEWRRRTVTYEDASIAEVVTDLNRFFPRPIEIADPALAKRRVTLRLQVEDRETTLQTLNALLGVRVERPTP